MSRKALTDKQARFVEEYLVDLNATQAAIRAGYSKKTARQIGEENLSKPDIATAVQAAMDERAKATAITAENVLKRLWEIACADPNDVVQYRRVCCRNCHGTDHHYQWIDEAEFDEAISEAIEDQIRRPDDKGGYGFMPNRPPVETCPQCGGEGLGRVHGMDSRTLTGPARLLYAGAKVTKDGFEIKLRDQDKALDMIARHLGLYKDKVEVEVTDIAAIVAARRAQVAEGR
jgi:phage terminase small subunit